MCLRRYARFNSGENKALNRIMNETVLSVIADVDLVLVCR